MGFASRPEVTAARRARVLVVEDGLFNRALVRALLEQDAYEVETAEDGAEAVAAVCAMPDAFDLLLMDLDMPVMDGFAATRTIRNLDDDRACVPILGLGACTKEDDLQRAFASGMDGHIAKPFAPGAFVGTIRRCLDEAEEARLARQRSGSVAASPVWNRRVYDELCRRLGIQRIRSVLAMFEQRLAQARSVLDLEGASGNALAFEAHDLISSAGLLGFEQLCATAHRVQISLKSGTEEMDGASCRQARAELSGAVGRASDTVTRILGTQTTAASA